MTTAGIQITENQRKKDGTIGTRVSIQGCLDDPAVFIDGMKVEINDLKYLKSYDLESISVYKGPSTAIFGSAGANGVIAISLKRWEERKAQKQISLTKVTPLGYQKPAEFYVPKYEVDSVRLSDKADLRTTIYWNPELETDSAGTVHVKFYTADKANNYSVVMEGITKSGEICRFAGHLSR